MALSKRTGSTITSFSFAAAGCWLAFHMLNQQEVLDNLPALVAIIATVSVTLLGFIITSVAILTSLGGKTLIENLKETGFYSELMSEFFYSAAAFFVSTVTSTCALLFTGSIANTVILFNIFIILLGLFLFASAGRHFYLVISEVT